MNGFVSFVTFVVQSVVDNTTAFVPWITRFQLKQLLQNLIRGNLKRGVWRTVFGFCAIERNSRKKWSKIGDIAWAKRGMRSYQC